jgi:hypothetical protein
MYLSDSNVAFLEFYKLVQSIYVSFMHVGIIGYLLMKCRELLLGGKMFWGDTRLQKVQLSKEEIVHYQESWVAPVVIL